MENEFRVLQILNSLGHGGIETVITNIHREIDRSIINFDYAIMSGKSSDYASKVQEFGANIYIYPQLSMNNFPYFISWWRHFFANTGRKYSIVHAHAFTTASLYLPIAKKVGAYTIIHAHSTNLSAKGKLKSRKAEIFIRKALLHPYRYAKWIDDRFACSILAGKWLYGNKVSFKIIKNGVDLEKLRFNIRIRDKYRKDFSLEGRFVIGHVGNSVAAKNHMFLLEIFKNILTKVPSAMLLLIGSLNEKMDQISEYINKNNLKYNVRILGTRSDVPEIMMAMDAFVFPSIYEGLPVTLIEAQASGLPCIVSDRITEEAKISKNYIRCSLGKPAEYWADHVISYYSSFDEVDKTEIRNSAWKTAKYSGYDIRYVANKLQKYYFDHKR